jgi:hypothetical protein
MRAIQLVQRAAGTDLGPEFRESLCAARCSQGKMIPAVPTRTAADLYDEIAAANQLA